MTVTNNAVYPPATREVGTRRRELAPEIHQAFDAFSARVFADGALPGKTKQLIAVAAAHVTQCPYCIRGHTKLAHQAGASDQEIYGGDLGCCGDARGRRLRSFHHRPACP
jgi:AhpD family alkylhydroperoxidase